MHMSSSFGEERFCSKIGLWGQGQNGRFGSGQPRFPRRGRGWEQERGRYVSLRSSASEKDEDV